MMLLHKSPRTEQHQITGGCREPSPDPLHPEGKPALREHVKGSHPTSKYSCNPYCNLNYNAFDTSRCFTVPGSSGMMRRQQPRHILAHLLNTLTQLLIAGIKLLGH